MRLVRRTLLVALIALSLCAASSAQRLRPEDDPRNQSPTVGTGGPEGGPTGLFTIYDGQTLRRGEFTFSIAYSNYDRDPGNVDIADVPLSFNVGLTNHLELFFKTNGYRGIKVNSPQNLSSFYLPNSQLYISVPTRVQTTTPSGVTVSFVNGPVQLASGAAIILAPNGPNVGNIAGQSVFRPVGNQPFVQFPFVGGSAGTFGQGPGSLGSLFGFPGFNAQIGVPTGGSSNFGSASNFPGMGSPVGSILPGIVFATTVLPATALTQPQIVPVSFTTQPSYLPDAPFINRLYGESSFTDYVVGAKWRWTGLDNPLGVGIIPFYRFYPDRANDLKGFNQLQRGASPGANLGDFGLIGFIDGRLTKHVNVSANGGYILNSNPKGDFGGNEATLLDRPDELIAGVGFDFPLNKHFQPIFELKSVHYMAGHTPNAFPNNPVDGLAGIKVYPRRWWGFGAWYRLHMNSQNTDHLNAGTDTNVNINQLSGVFVPGRGVVIVPGTTRPATSGGFPLGFKPSEDPHGFGFQFFAGHRNLRAPTVLPNNPPTVTVSASQARVTLAAQCGPDMMADPSCTPTGSTVNLTANASDPDGDTLLYTWSTTGGRITGDGANVTWDLSGAAPGTYTANVEVDDGCGCIAYSSTTVVVDRCNCVPTPVPPTPVPTPVMTPTPAPPPAPTPTKFDQYGNIPRNDVKARLDNFANELQAQPGAQGYIIAYGGRKGVAGEAQRRADFAKDYLVNTRGVDAGRLVTLDGGFQEEASTELWIVPTGATPPTASPTVDASQVQTTKAPTRRRGSRRRRDDEE
ncbi:MAG: PKD domain-containing protein [Pyrinomonadaceae bacterium]